MVSGWWLVREKNSRFLTVARSAGYFHTAGRRMKFPWVPTGIASGSWHLAGRSRGKEMWECESMEMVGWWNEKMKMLYIPPFHNSTIFIFSYFHTSTFIQDRDEQ